MDVETILNRIRDRVISEADAGGSHVVAEIGDRPQNGASSRAHQSEALERAGAYLAVTARAWDRLPPVHSNRYGALGRLEIWLKRTCKPLTRWFTWEQVNFNRAVNDALGDVVETLKTQAQDMSALRAQLTALRAQLTHELNTLDTNQQGFRSEAEERLVRLTELLTALGVDHSERYARLEHKHASLIAEHRSLVAEHEKLADEVIALAGQLRAEDLEIRSHQDMEINRRLSDLAAELKEDQRVCFRQLSLEATESAVLEDRARRAVLARLEKLEKIDKP